MITFVFITFALLQLSNQQTVEQLIDDYVNLVATVKPDCLKESGADSDVIDAEVRLGKFAWDQNSKCFWKCYLKKLNIINDNDEIVEKNIIQYIGLSDKEVVDKIYKKCAPLRGSDLCDTSDKICKCVYTEAIAAVTK
ncbi:hypothetical protein ILUMI_02296 [Ignelater luminosus]|uniref:Uncharacterized protein n=1 Tax=Ignelater luminosus TaxID=2038154 RepID=A0A8K0DCZ3_IGNLU|nr:hypothetical protein ILUMI_02296 [Ignelater luminosus]